MKDYLKRILPANVVRILGRISHALRILVNYLYDCGKYIRWSASMSPFEGKRKLQGRIIERYHGIEKGLSLRDIKVNFGRRNAQALLRLLAQYVDSFGFDEVCAISLNNLMKYYEYNKNCGVDDKRLHRRLLSLKSREPEAFRNYKSGGVVKLSRDDIQKAISINFHDFVKSRYSIRNFEPGTVDNKKIAVAVEISRKTPSVCNRQAWRVRLYSGERKDRILELQGGNRGFGEYADKLMIITGELALFYGVDERNQVFIDLGMYSMMLVLALHSQGIGTCSLSLNVGHRKEKEIKKIAQIPDSEVLIMGVALGNIPESLYVAESPRRRTEEFFAEVR